MRVHCLGSVSAAERTQTVQRNETETGLTGLTVLYFGLVVR